MKSKNKQPETGREILKNLQKREKPVRVGWGPASAILVTLAIYLGSQLLAGYLLVQYLIITGTPTKDIGKIVEDSVPVQFGFVLITGILSIFLLWLFLHSRQISWQRIGLSKPTTRNLLYALPGYAVYFIIILITFVLIEKLVPSIDIRQEQQIGFETAAGPIALSLVFVALVILPALVEEIIVRGFLYGGLRNKLKSLSAALVASLVFGAAHLQVGSGESLVWIAAIDTFILSMVLIWLREKTGNIWAGVVVHTIKNSLAFLTLFIFKTL